MRVSVQSEFNSDELISCLQQACNESPDHDGYFFFVSQAIMKHLKEIGVTTSVWTWADSVSHMKVVQTLQEVYLDSKGVTASPAGA